MLGNISKDILYLISLGLPIKDILNLGCVNQNFSKILSDNKFWKCKFHIDFPNTSIKEPDKNIYRMTKTTHKVMNKDQIIVDHVLDMHEYGEMLLVLTYNRTLMTVDVKNEK